MLQVSVTLYLIITLLSIITPYNIIASEESYQFPSLQDAETFIHLSKAVYKIDSASSCEEYSYKDDIKCVYQQKVKKYGTNVIIAKSKKMNFIAVVYAGTDGYNDVVNADMDIRLVPFGPKDDPINESIYVHNGFNNGVFEHDVFDNLLSEIQSFLAIHKNYRLCTAGHSLGGAEAALTATAFSYYFPNRSIQHLSIGEPMSGDDSWMDYVNNNTNLSMWRFVYELDLVARMCGEKHTTYKHVGHTVQFDSKHCAKAYYLHHGNDDLDYKGVPSNWESHALDSFTIAVADHLTFNYKWYMDHRVSKDSDCYFVDRFEIIETDVVLSLQ